MFMKHYLSTNRRAHSLNYLTTVAMSVASLLLMTSCDKMSQLVDSMKDLGGQGNASSTVDQMNQAQAQALIGSESKLVMVEFYTDT